MDKGKQFIQSIGLFNFMCFGLGLFAVILFIASILMMRKDIKNNRVILQKKKNSFLLKSYQVFRDFSLSRRYIERMRLRYEMICPDDAKLLMCKTINNLYFIWVISFIILITIFLLNPSFYSATLAAIIIAVFNYEWLEYQVEGMEIKLLEQFDKFISDVRHSFYRHGMIDEAIADASELSGHIMKVNATKLQSVLENQNKDGAIRRYNETISNRFLKMFLSLSVYVSEFGDKLINGVSVLLLNIQTLKNDIYIDIMNRKETSYKFGGLTFIVLAPVFAISFIRNWSISISPELAEFYQGSIAVAIELLAFIVTVIGYIMLNELKGRHIITKKEHYVIKKLSDIKMIKKSLSNYVDKNRVKAERIELLLYRVGEVLTVKQFLLKRLLAGFSIFSLCILIAFSVHKENREKLMNSSQFKSNITGIMNDKQAAAIAPVVKEYVREFKDLPLNRTKLEKKLRQAGVIRGEAIFKITVDEIILRIKRYKNEFFHWPEFVIAFFASYVAYSFPYLMLLYRKRIMNLDMGNEVAQFQSTIMMVMNLNDTTVQKILELMESFAVIFKDSLKNCINEYASGDIDALEKLKLNEKYEPFRRLVDNLIIADKIGVKKAFDEVVEERKASQEMRNQEYKISRDKKVVYGMIIAFIPAVIIVGFYWIIPFSLNSLARLKDYDEAMKSLQ